MAPSRRSSQRDALLGEVLDAAMQQIDDAGPAALNWRAVARSVGVGASTLYTYFDGVDGLYTAVISRAFDDLAVAVAADVDRGAIPRSRIEAAAHAYRRWARAHPARFNLVFTDVLVGYDAPADGPTVGAQAGALATFTDAFAELFGVRSPDIERWSRRRRRRALVFWSGIHGQVMLEINHHLDWTEDADGVFADLLALLLTEAERD